MGIAGNLNTMILPDLLQVLSIGKRTGTLRLNTGEVEKSIFFKAGTIVSASSNDPKEYLGHFLVSHGLIDEVQLERAVRRQASAPQLLGMILVEQGAISADDLYQMLRLKAEQTIFELFFWTEGDFSFLDDQLPEYEIVPISLDVQELLMEGMQRVDEWDQIRELIPSDQAVPVAVTDLLDNPKLGDRDRLVLGLVDDRRSIEEIGLHARTSEYFVSRVLYRSALKGKIKVVRPRIVTVGGSPQATSGSALMISADRHLKNGELVLAYRHIKAAQSLEPSNPELMLKVKAVAASILTAITNDGVSNDAIPRLVVQLKELTKHDLSPQEGFIASRVNGTSDVAAIVKISPLPEIEAVLVFWKLYLAGYLELLPKRIV